MSLATKCHLTTHSLLEDWRKSGANEQFGQYFLALFVYKAVLILEAGDGGVELM